MAETAASLAAPPDGIAVGRRNTALTAWAAIGLIALGIAGVMAILLAVSRIPGVEGGIPWPIGFFRKGLIIHVVMSIVVWFAAVFAALAALAATPRAGETSSFAGSAIAAAMLAAALPCLLLPAFLDRSEASLNNYVPVIVDPLYYAGLVLLYASQTLIAVQVLVKAPRPWRALPAEHVMTIVAAMIVLVALFCFAVAFEHVSGTPHGYWFNENLMWGGGHVLQFANTAIMIVGWLALSQVMTGTQACDRRLVLLAAAVLLAGVLPAPVFYFVYPAFSGPQADAVSNLKYLAGVPAVLIAIAIVRRLPRPLPWAQPALQCLAMSLLLFGVGGLFGIFVDGADTRTPAHYHGMIAGVSLAAMGLFFFRFLPALRRPAVPARRIKWAVHLFGWGQLVACIGLFVAGGYGAPRKVAGAAQGVTDWAAMLGLGLNGLGGLIAVIGGIVFVLAAGASLLGAPASPERPAASVRPR